MFHILYTKHLPFRLKKRQSDASKQPIRIRWCFTHQLERGIELDENAVDEEASFLMGQLLDHSDCFVFQLEMSPTTGQPHFQGYFELVNKKRMSWIKTNIHPFHFLVPAKGSPKQNLAYCTKSESRLHGPWMVGEFRVDENANKTELFCKDVIAGKSDLELVSHHPSSFCRYPRIIDRLRTTSIPVRTTPLEVYLFFGPPGVGKTEFAYQQGQQAGYEPYELPIGKDFWTSPAMFGHKYVILDEFKANLGLKDLLKILDVRPIEVPLKGGFQWWCPDIVVITTNVSPWNWYRYENRNFEREALFRRITGCFTFVKNAQLVPRPVEIDIHNQQTFEDLITSTPPPLQIAANKRMLALTDFNPAPLKKAKSVPKAKPDSTKLYDPTSHGVVVKNEPVFIDLVSDDEEELHWGSQQSTQPTQLTDATRFDLHNEQEEAAMDLDKLKATQDCIYCFKRICVCFDPSDDENLVIVISDNDSIEDSDLDV